MENGTGASVVMKDTTHRVPIDMEEKVWQLLQSIEKHIPYHYQQPSISPEPLLKLIAVSKYIPKQDPEKPRGDDANFVYDEYNCIGVADGVGGHWKYGIDPGEYARQLMANSVVSLRTQLKGLVNPIRVLWNAYLKTKNKGSSTACIIALNGNVLHAANVGDSGFIVIRDGKVVYKSKIQTRGFNYPYQLGNERDNPSVAHEIKLCVEKGDIIVAGTDGLFDNLSVGQILQEIMSGNTVTTSASNNISKHEIQYFATKKARKIANFAWRTSVDSSAYTPFTREAIKAGLTSWPCGGKVDDITVIVAYVASSQII